MAIKKCKIQHLKGNVCGDPVSSFGKKFYGLIRDLGD